jgi:hypothetical protein
VAGEVDYRLRPNDIIKEMPLSQVPIYEGGNIGGMVNVLKQCGAMIKVEDGCTILKPK